MVLLKLAALLRIADALDRSHAQRIRSMVLRPEAGRLRIITPGVEDTTIEQIAIDSKGGIFKEIYGLEVVLSPS
jgi:exopolyphosphatase/guanosine-5'-triphosphate,3'-diphosphate pyrophosphatase